MGLGACEKGWVCLGLGREIAAGSGLFWAYLCILIFWDLLDCLSLTLLFNFGLLIELPTGLLCWALMFNFGPLMD